MGNICKLVIAQSAKMDVKNKKRYILEKFRYRDYAENFSAKIKHAAQELDILPMRYGTTGFVYRGYEIYLEPTNNLLLANSIANKIEDDKIREDTLSEISKNIILIKESRTE